MRLPGRGRGSADQRDTPATQRRVFAVQPALRAGDPCRRLRPPAPRPAAGRGGGRAPFRLRRSGRGDARGPGRGLGPVRSHGAASPVETLRERERRRAGDDVGDPGKAGAAGASQPAGGGGRAWIARGVAARDRPGGRVVPRRVGGSAVRLPVHRPGALALRRGRAQARGRRAGLARARRAVRPSLLGRARPGRA